MNGYNGYSGFDEKQHLDEDAFGPKAGSSIVSAFDAFRESRQAAEQSMEQD